VINGFLCASVDSYTDWNSKWVSEFDSQLCTEQLWYNGFSDFQMNLRTYLSLLKHLCLINKIPAACRYIVKRCKKEYLGGDDEYKAWVAGLYFEIAEASRIFFGAEIKIYLKARKDYEKYALITRSSHHKK
jgi:hypothetical protein